MCFLTNIPLTPQLWPHEVLPGSHCHAVPICVPVCVPICVPICVPFACPFWPLAERVPQQWLASLLAVLIVRGRSRAGLCLKKPTGLRWKPTISTGITAPSKVLSIVEPNAGTYLKHVALPQSSNVSPAHAKHFWHLVAKRSAGAQMRHTWKVFWATEVSSACTGTLSISDIRLHQSLHCCTALSAATVLCCHTPIMCL